MTRQSGRIAQDVGADDAAQHGERIAHLGGAQRRVDGGAGRVLERDAPLAHGGGKARRRAELAEADRRGLDLADRARADQQIGAEARGRHGHETQVLRARAG